MYSELTQCIVCGKSDFEEVVNLGEQYVVDFVPEKDENLLRAPLILQRCINCSMVQIKHRVNPDRLYRKFWYRSGINEQMGKELLAIVQHAQNTVDLKQGDKVLDIGCNDGTMLGCYIKGVQTFGVDPCASLVEEGIKAGNIDIGIPDYFSSDAIHSVSSMFGVPAPKFKIITAVAMFYDVTNPVRFLRDCKEFLHEDGVLVIQMNYLMTMLKDSAFDNICHEHVGYYSVTTLKKVIETAGLELQGVEFSKSNGGSVRAYITHQNARNFYPTNVNDRLWLHTNVQMKLVEEAKFGLHSDVVYKEFNSTISYIKEKLLRALSKIVDKRVYVYGASTRGTVTAQYIFGSGDNGDKTIPIIGVAERDPKKYGLKMVGTWWPIVSEDEARLSADYFICLPWHFKDSIIKREHKWFMNGGKMIFPLPTPVVVEQATGSEVLVGEAL